MAVYMAGGTTVTFIKEYTPTKNGYRFVIRRRDYGSNMRHLLELYDQARADFADISTDQLDVVHYGGQRFKHTYGLEFNSTDEPPEGYERIEQLEMVL